MSERFFVESPVSGHRAVLDGDEARHLSRVMRAAVGDDVILFDGSGAEFLARIAAIGKSQVELAIIERRPIDRELPFQLTLAVALPKGDRQKWLVEKATELGVTRLVPLITERGVAQPVEAALSRLRRGVIEASKQCGRNRLMEIAEPIAANSLFSDRVQGPKSKVQSQASNERSRAIRLLADAAGSPLAKVTREVADIVCAVGPEGGFTTAEVAAAVEHGWQPVSLGASTLRVETAAVAITAWSALR